ncbi:hypothetical protein ACFVAJ_18305 [Agromyces sp. NPDC057679]|uniref:hypothetical protein n=1 Tax=Agromyces sp. NPDC057679 TaxID=3346207 RepID=UPI00366E8188
MTTSPADQPPRPDLLRKLRLKEEIAVLAVEARALESKRQFGWWQSYGILAVSALVALASGVALSGIAFAGVPLLIVSGILIAIATTAYASFSDIPARITQIAADLNAKRDEYNSLRTPEMPVEVSA